MTQLALQNVDLGQFLRHYWQQQHLFIESALPEFEAPLDPSHLAGLSLEENAESRLILEDGNGQFSVANGPFQEDTFEFIDAENWTLLVQAVDHWIEEIQQLKGYFSFIPAWRLDDIMISYAPTGGSVGPHFDQYDVFLLQASGERRWKIGQHCDDASELVPNQQIKILQDFATQAEYVCKRGDILYVPPGLAHWGVSESDDCMTISIGFRAPSVEELGSELLHQAAELLGSQDRFTDPELTESMHPNQIKPADVAKLKALLLEKLLDDDNLAATLGKLMTEPKYADEYVRYPVESGVIRQRPDSRLAYFVEGGKVTVFANGETIPTEVSEDFVKRLCSSDIITNENLTDEQVALIGELIDLGVFEDVA